MRTCFQDLAFLLEGDEQRVMREIDFIVTFALNQYLYINLQNSFILTKDTL